MSKRPRPLRRGRVQPHVPTFDELAEADGADVSQLLREVSEFRLALDTDLTIAAAAADAVAEHIAPAELSRELTGQALDAGRGALDDLVTRRRLDVASIHPRLASAAVAAPAADEVLAANGALAPEVTALLPGRARRSGSRRGQTGPAVGRPAGRRLRGVPLIGVGPLVGVAIVLGVGTGFFASNLHGSSQSRSQGLTNAADSSLHSLSSALGNGNDQAAREAGNQLSAAIGSLIAAAPDNPAAAQAAASALIAEQGLLANTAGALGEQLRASMAAQVVALQSTVHTPIATLLTPATRAHTPTLTIPVTLPTRLIPPLPTVVVLPSLGLKPTPSRRPAASHSPDPDASVITIVIPTPPPSAANPAGSAPTHGATPSVSATASSSASPSATGTSTAGNPAGSPSPSSGPSNPLPLSTSASGAGNFFPH